jgi:transcriptional regulator with XRE-family HTH domain
MQSITMVSITLSMETPTSKQQPTETLGARLRRLRTDRNLSAADMARLIGVAPTTYREWEKGRGLVAPPLLKMSEVLAISVTELLSGEKPELNESIERLREIETLVRQVRLKLGTVT